jgi:hypothetical protein
MSYLLFNPNPVPSAVGFVVKIFHPLLSATLGEVPLPLSFSISELYHHPWCMINLFFQLITPAPRTLETTLSLTGYWKSP